MMAIERTPGEKNNEISLLEKALSGIKTSEASSREKSRVIQTPAFSFTWAIKCKNADKDLAEFVDRLRSEKIPVLYMYTEASRFNHTNRYFYQVDNERPIEKNSFLSMSEIQSNYPSHWIIKYDNILFPYQKISSPFCGENPENWENINKTGQILSTMNDKISLESKHVSMEISTEKWSDSRSALALAKLLGTLGPQISLCTRGKIDSTYELVESISARSQVEINACRDYLEKRIIMGNNDPRFNRMAKELSTPHSNPYVYKELDWIYNNYGLVRYKGFREVDHPRIEFTHMAVTEKKAFDTRLLKERAALPLAVVMAAGDFYNRPEEYDIRVLRDAPLSSLWFSGGDDNMKKIITSDKNSMKNPEIIEKMMELTDKLIKPEGVLRDLIVAALGHSKPYIKTK